MEKKKVNLGLSIAGIVELGFYVNEEVSLPEGKEAGLNITLSVEPQLAEEMVRFTVEAGFNLPDEPARFLAGGKVRTDYKVENLKSLAVKQGEEERLELPDQIAITMLSIAISHLRALLARSVCGTRHSHLILPIVNPAELFQQVKAKATNE
ncbi:hypothetical protein [Cesiribacter andamanensis]|uniref:Preprotein translocase subunit SecB n=1 Tax=Cesiribacter andamanensis AMV16 TaxID=1279009 RepID=M7NG74_9BACT|nr:hypothetical protein [Cesiribacter andamanensis]EMR00805.1 hypothetical protein ADICEAN_04078 [Cesiribacter andamanensis AMV16]